MDLLCLNTSGELSIDSICQADIVSAACSACVINVCLSAIIYIRCTQHIRCGSLLPRHCTRSLLFLVLLLAHLTEMADGALQYLQDQQRPLLIVVPTLSLAGWCAALALVRVIETDGRAGFLSVTGALWLLCGAGKALRLVYLVETGVELRHVRLGATAWVTASFVALSVVDLHGLVRCKRKGELQVTEVEEPPRGYRHATAHLFSQATFSWLTGLLWVGYCSPLEIEDLGQLPEEETTERQLNLFNCIYEKEKNAARNENRRVSLWKCYFKSCWRRFLLGGFFKLLGDFVGFVGPLGIMVILEYVAAIQKPPDNIIGGNKDHYPTWSELLSNGYFMGLIVFLSALAQGTLSQSSTHLINVEGIHLKGALQALVYIKALRLCVWSISEHKDEDVSASPEKKDSRPNGSLSPPGNCPSDTKIKGPPGTDMGAITNLMSEDAFNVMSFFWIGHYIWAIPLKICVLMYFLYLKLGWSAIIGAAFCILTMTPLQFLIGKKMSSNSKAITELSDERLRRMNEVLQGIKLLKLYGWECIYGTRIVETRKRELGLLDKDAVYWALLTFLTHASSVLVTLVTFGVYFSMEEGALSPGNVFTGLALFNQLTVPLFIFPITVPVIISAMVSTKRLEDFLSLPETSDPISQNEPQEHPYASDINKEDKELRIEEDTITKTSIAPVEALHNNTEVVMGRPQSDDNLFGLGNILEGEEHPDDEEGGEVYPEDDEAALTVERALFSWSADSTKSVLSLDDVSIMKGKLTIIIGRVGSGKTSLLSSILGEMNKISGTVKWASDTTVAYAAQKPWLLNATLRDNILFGQAYRPRRYKRVIGACALQPDIDILPGKDLTEIGEKGINMSGGQKQRIAVARALYSQANVVVLDDPLSALDYQVGQQVFEEGIRRMLLRQRRTVILVTHRLQLLSYAHKIIAVEQGSVRAQGNLSEIESVDPELVRTWKATMSREALEGQRNVGGRTAKERWKLVKLVSRIGVQLKQRNVADGTWQTDEETHVTPPLFVPLRKRLATFSGSRYLTHDLPLPIDECEADLTERTGRCRPSLRRHRAATMADTPGGHKAVLRAFSLQTGRQERLPFPVVRQFSSPSIRGDPMAYRSRMYTVDSHPQGSLLRRLFHHQSQRTVASAPEVSGSIKEKNVLRRLMSSSSTKSTSAAMESVKTPVKRLLSTTSASSDDAYEEDDCCDEATDAGEGRTMSEEEREYGKIPKRIYLDYLRACGVVAGVSYLLSAVLWQGLRVYTDYWLSQWTHHSNDTAVDHREDQRQDETVFYFGVYASLSAASIILSLLSNGIGQYAGAQARRTLHDNMLHNLLKCPMKFFESTPVGRIINRFSMDTGLIDKKLATSIQRLLQFLLLCFSAILVNAVVTPWFLLAAVPICATYYVVQHFYRYSSRELQRLDSITRSPIFSHFSETLGGLTTIRAFSHQQRFTDMLLRKMDTHANAFLIMNTANRWLGIALDYLGGVIVLMAIVASLVTATLLPGQVPPALVGLAVNYTLLVPIYLNWVVKFLADVEMYMNDVERVQQYATTPTEDYRTQGVSVPHSWPEKGDIVFENVSLRYDSKREPVVTNLNLHIPPGQKVGICGRTGSGKSSLVMSLFHMVDVYEGSIEIDGIDITQVPLQILRSRLSIIPQDVIMFSGTIRENLDPRHQYSDEDLWRSLEMAQLKDIVSSYQGCLDGEVREGGENLSAGERQLFCLARAILHDAACLIMDEATSSVDPGTEKALLAAAAKAFANKTVITIAHRLPTILECDRIVVLDEGRIAEDGSPAELMNKSMGVFSSMLKASNEGAFS